MEHPERVWNLGLNEAEIQKIPYPTMQRAYGTGQLDGLFDFKKSRQGEAAWYIAHKYGVYSQLKHWVINDELRWKNPVWYRIVNPHVINRAGIN